MARARLPPAPARITAIYAGTCAAGCVHLPLSAWATDTKDTFSPKGRVKNPRTTKGSVEGLENNEISIHPQTNEGTRPKICQNQRLDLHNSQNFKAFIARLTILCCSVWFPQVLLDGARTSLI